ncbi:uncharacterized protein LOC135840506 isoform X2 [Planococcus citri]|uniref:uncharacterized protein LOC135840506 isoform X2 n=1 Tax=Planococcus citri TaxID=170843 RepID=UPI0031F8372D
MGCSNSKSTPIVDSNTDENIGQTMLKNGKAVMMDAENRLGEMKDAVHNAAANMEAKLLNSPLTQRAGCNETTDSNIANDGDFSDTDTNVEHEIPVTMTLSRDDDVDGGTSDKPSTPMPEAVKMNAQWPFMVSETGEKPPRTTEEVARATPLDTITEEKRLVTIPSSEEIGATAVEILTIEIAEIPIEDDPGEVNDQNKDEESKENENEEEKEKEKENDE